MKPLSAARVRNILKASGLSKAEYHRSGMVCGWGEWSRGYEVKGGLRGMPVIADWHPGGCRRGDEEGQVGMLDALRAAGLSVEKRSFDWIVSYADEEQR